MNQNLRAIVLAAVLGVGGLATATPASAQNYHRSGVSVSVGVGARTGYDHRRYERRHSYRRSDYNRARWWHRDRCYRYRNCGNHRGWQRDRW